jgi:hypothetical protein
MDKFEQVMQQMEHMNKEEMAKLFESSKKLCICPNCPTYADLARERKELLFCALGKTRSIANEKSCICPSCPVTGQVGLKHTFFCTRDSEKEQRRRPGLGKAEA